jgi:hypothetical protein
MEERSEGHLLEKMSTTGRRRDEEKVTLRKDSSGLMGSQNLDTAAEQGTPGSSIPDQNGKKREIMRR